MTRKALALAVVAMMVVMVGGTGRAQAAGGTYRITAGGNSDWTPKTGGLDQTSSDKIETTGTLTDMAIGGAGVNGNADFHIAAGPGVVRAKIGGSWAVPSNNAYVFSPSLQAVSTTELTVSGPDGDLQISVNVHVDGIIASPVCNGRDYCGAESVSIQVGPFTRVSAFNTLPGVQANQLGLAFDPVAGGYRVHGDVTSAQFGVHTNTPIPITIALALQGGYSGSPAISTFGSDDFDEPLTLQQVSFAPSGPVLNGIPAGYTVSGPSVVDNHWIDPFAPQTGDVVVTNCADPALAGLATVSGSLIFRNLAGCPEIALSSLTSVGGDLIVEGTDATRIAIPGPVVVTGSVRIVDNDAATDIGIGSGGADSVTIDGDLDVSGNGTSASIDVGNGQIGGSLTIVDNGATIVNLGDLISVDGNLDLESAGDVVSGTTAGGVTDVTILGGVATMHVGLPNEAFAQPVGFTITRRFDDPAEQGSDAAGAPALIDPIAGFEFAFDVPTLNADAQLTFVIDMSELDTTGRANLLNALGSGNATIVGKGDDANAQYQAFAVCVDAQTPAADGCVAIAFLAADGTPTDGNPALVRFDGVVGHFSTYAVATVFSVPADVTPPALSVPTDFVVDATSPAGANVTFSASAFDTVDPSPSLVCTPASGSLMPIGTTAVTCTATDASGNHADATFDVHVRGAGEQIASLVDTTRADLGLPVLLPALKAPLRAATDALAAGRPHAACVALDIYIVIVALAPARAFTGAEKAELVAGARRIRATIGC